MYPSVRTRPPPLGRVVGLIHLAGMTRVRLLADHVLAGGQRAHRPLVVERVRERDVDRVDAAVAEQRVVRRVRGCDAVLVRIRLCAGPVPRTDRDDLERRVVCPRTEDRPVDAGCREEAEAHA
jgi:hypothetical protein